MTLDDLRGLFRSDADDAIEAFFFSDEEVERWFVEAQEEAVARADLLHESEDDDICQIAVTAGTAVYPLEPRVLRVTYAQLTPAGATCPVKLTIIDRTELQRIDPNWRERTEEPRYLIQDGTRVSLACKPDVAGVLRIECYRLPLVPVSDTVAPEIATALHRHLVQWVLHRAFSKPDSETIDPIRAAKALADFERVFGLRMDAHLKREFEARPQYTKAYF